MFANDMQIERTTDIVIVTYFRREFTRRTIQYLRERTRLPYRLVVVDNGSTDGTPEMLKEMLLPTDKLVLLKQNVGLEAAKNVALDIVSSQRIVDSDNDILVPMFKDGPCWLERLHGLMDRNPGFGAIALRPQILVGVGPIFRTHDEVVSNNVCGGSMRMMDLQIVRDVGGWRDEFTNRSEEWEICGKIKKKGLKVGYAKDLFCYHLFGDDKRWGYGDEVRHYHAKDTVDFTDRGFSVDPETLVPSFLHNE